MKKFHIKRLSLFFQNYLGFNLEDFEDNCSNNYEDKSYEKLVKSILLQSLPINPCSQVSSEKLLLCEVVTLEARLQAEVIYSLHAVMQFLNW